MIAGKTESQISAAKRAQAKRLGQPGAAGKSKRCKKGKSCGATCINSGKVCLVDIPWATGKQIGKLANTIQASKKDKEKEKVERVKKPSSVKTALSSLETDEDFWDLANKTEKMKDIPEMVKGSSEVAKIMGVQGDGFPSGQTLYSSPEEKSKYQALRTKVGRGVISDGANALDQYTGSFKSARLARLAERDPNNSELTSFDRLRAKHLGALLNLKEMPRPEVEKYRGFRATPERLQEMIDGARGRESFKHDTTYSWTSSLSMGNDFARREVTQLPERDQRVIFRAINKRGVPIEFVSSVDGESELLTPKNTRYRYLGGYREINIQGMPYHVFDVEELP
jgi:hypothetical protein